MQLGKIRMHFYLYVVSMPLLLSLGLFFCFVSQPYSFEPVCFSFSFFCVITVFRAIKRYGLFSLYCLYLYTSFFFVYSKLFFSALGVTDFLYVDFPGKHHFSENTGIYFIVGSFISFYVLDIFYFCKSWRLPEKIKIKSAASLIKQRKIMTRIGTIFMSLAFIPILYKLYLQLQIIRQTGYVSLYTGALDSISYPFWTKGSGTVFYIGFLLVLMSFPGKKTYIYAVLLFIFFRFADALKGGRGGLISTVLAVIYFYYKLYGVKFSIKKMLPLFAVLVVFSAVIGQSRTETAETQKKSVSTKLLCDFVINQSGSIGSPLAVIEFVQKQKPFRHYPYIFSLLFTPIYNFISPETESVPSLERLQLRNEMEGIITYLYSPFMYKSGFGIGATFSGEMFDCFGLLGIVFWTIMLGRLILFVEKSCTFGGRKMFWAWFIACSVIVLPRSHFFDFLYSGYMYFFLILGIEAILNTKGLIKKKSAGAYKNV